MYLVDSHCHLDQLDLAPYNGDLSKALAFAKEQGIGHFLSVCVTLADFPRLLEIAKTYPQVSTSVGLHPNEEVLEEPSADTLTALITDDKIVAVGETGLDYYRSSGDTEWQRERFRQHIRAAKKTQRPLIIHSRQAKADTLQIMKEEDAASVGGVLHCFTEDWEMASAAMDLNFYVSFSGIVTFQNAKEIQAVAKALPIDRMLIETDSPYLAPVPHRGKSNEPAYVRHVAEYIANLRGINGVELANKTTENFFNCFKKAKK